MALLESSQRLLSREFRIQGSSMEPGVPSGSFVRISPMSYFWRTPRRGEVVVLRSPETSERFDLKRVIGLPGESVTWEGGRIWINGSLLGEPYATGFEFSGDEQKRMLALGPGGYFVAGDNRPYSQDSRAYGPVWLSNIIGQIVEDGSKIFLANHTYV